MGPLSQALSFLGGLTTPILYLLLAGGALLENLVPPVPADTFVVVGGLLASRGAVDPVLALGLIWVANVAGALAVYVTGRSYGHTFFTVGAGRLLLNPPQMTRIQSFYRRWGILAIFTARFFPGLRAVVPAFAGVSHLGFWKVAPPLALASAIWYGFLFWAGMAAGRNLGWLEDRLSEVNTTLLVGAVILGVAVAVWWIRTRREHRDGESHDE